MYKISAYLMNGLILVAIWQRDLNLWPTIFTSTVLSLHSPPRPRAKSDKIDCMLQIVYKMSARTRVRARVWSALLARAHARAKYEMVFEFMVKTGWELGQMNWPIENDFQFKLLRKFVVQTPKPQTE